METSKKFKGDKIKLCKNCGHRKEEHSFEKGIGWRCIVCETCDGIYIKCSHTLKRNIKK